MPALRGDVPVVEHHHHVGQFQGAQALRDDEGGAARQQPAQGIVNQLLGVRIDAGGGVVEDQDARIHQNGPRNGDPLPLAAGQSYAALAHHGVVALVQAHHVVVDAGRLRRRVHVGVGGVRGAERNVVPNAGGKQHRILHHDPDLRAQRCDGHLAHVDAVDAHAARLRVVEAQHQPGQGGLAGAGRPEQRHDGARRNVQVHLAQRPPAGMARGAVHAVAAVTVGHPGHGHRAPNRRQRARAGPLLHAVGRIQDRRDALAGSGRHRQHRNDHADAADRREQLCHVGGERHQLADGQVAVDREHAAGADHDDQAEVGDQVEQRRVDRRQPRLLRRQREPGVVAGVEALHLVMLLSERLDQPHPAQILLQPPGKVAELLLQPGGQRPLAAPVVIAAVGEQRHGRQTEHAEQRVHADQQHQGADEQHRGIDHAQHRAAGEEADPLHVLHRALQELARLHAADQRHRHHGEPVEHLLAQVGRHALRDDLRPAAHQERQHRPRQRQQQQQTDGAPHHAQLVARNAVVDDPAHQLRDRQQGAAAQEHNHVDRHHAAPARRQVGEEAEVDPKRGQFAGRTRSRCLFGRTGTAIGFLQHRRRNVSSV